MNYEKNKFRKNPIYNCTKKNRDKFNQESKMPCTLKNYMNNEKVIKEHTNKWKDIPCSWIDLFILLKWPFHQNQSRFNAIPFKF